MRRFDKFFNGLLLGFVFSVMLIWIYLSSSYPLYNGFVATVKSLFPSILLGKLLILGVFPDIVLCFVFYKFDMFKIAAGFMCGGIPFLIASFFML